MHIKGSSILGGFGTDIEALPYSARATASPDSRTANTDALGKHLPPRALRRMDHFTRMTLLGAFNALADAALAPNSADMDGIGVVLATGHGPTQLTFDFLDGIIDHGPELASPLAFSHSVHNIPAASIAQHCGIAGPTCTVCQFETSVASALLTARSWLREGRCRLVLFGAVDERAAFLETCGTTIGRNAAGFADADGAVFLVLSLRKEDGRGCIRNVEMVADMDSPQAFSGTLMPRTSVHGHLPVAQAMDILLGLHALSGQCPSFMAPPSSMRSARYDQWGHTGIIDLAWEDE
jgi:3-oxoacyl-[acyl-carrier-protein] synthase II